MIKTYENFQFCESTETFVQPYSMTPYQPSILLTALHAIPFCAQIRLYPFLYPLFTSSFSSTTHFRLLPHSVNDPIIYPLSFDNHPLNP